NFQFGLGRSIELGPALVGFEVILILSAIGLERFQLFERAVKGALETRVMAGETVELFLEIVVGEERSVGIVAGAELCLHLADALELPRGGEQLTEEGLLERAFGLNVYPELDLH